MQKSEYKELVKTINETWIKRYGGEEVSELKPLTNRIRAISDDRDCWADSCRFLQVAFNKLEKKKG